VKALNLMLTHLKKPAPVTQPSQRVRIGQAQLGSRQRNLISRLRAAHNFNLAEIVGADKTNQGRPQPLPRSPQRQRQQGSHGSKNDAQLWD
jgi:hypothetical protein